MVVPEFLDHQVLLVDLVPMVDLEPPDLRDPPEHLDQLELLV